MTCQMEPGLIGRLARNKFRFRQLGVKLKGDREGSVLTLTAFVLPVVLGFSAMGVDLTLWYMERRELQSVADTAAVAGAYVALKDGELSDVIKATSADAMRNKFYSKGGEVLTTRTPPTTGAFAGKSQYVEVIARRPADLQFAQLFLSDPVMVSARAVAGAVSVGEHCIIALDETADRAVEFGGTANLEVDCGVASNSSSNTAIYVGGNAELKADPAQAYGDIYVGGNATLTTKSPPQAYSQRVDDPYGAEGRDLQVPPLGATCTGNKLKVKGTVTLSPGTYCGGLDVTAANVTFEPGVYLVEGDFTVSGNSSLVGEDVTFVMTGKTANSVGEVKFSGGTTADLSAPTTGNFAGVLFYQDQKANTGGSNSFVGGSTMILEGALYFPKQQLTFTGGSSASPACLQIIARKVDFLGNGYVTNDPDYCEDVGVEKVAQLRVRVLE